MKSMIFFNKSDVFCYGQYLSHLAILFPHTLVAFLFYDD